MWSINNRSISFPGKPLMNHVIRTAMNYYKNSASFLWWSQASARRTVKAANCCVSGGPLAPPPLVAAGPPPPPERKILALRTGHIVVWVWLQIIAHLEKYRQDRKGLQTLLYINEVFGNTVQRLDYCKRPILWLASSKILTSPPIHLTARRVSTPGRTQSLSGEGGGGSIFWKTPGTALYSVCKYFVGNTMHTEMCVRHSDAAPRSPPYFCPLW